MSRTPNPKIAGERAECAFVWQAMEHGLIVSKPYGDSTPYDFIVQERAVSRQRSAIRKKRAVSHQRSAIRKTRKEKREGRGGRLWRVQVKAVLRMNPCRGYNITTCHGSHRPYTREEIDFFAAWVVPFDAWYIIPIEAVGPVMGAGLYPHVQGSWGKYEQYREAWHLLGGEKPHQRHKGPRR